MKMIFVLGLLLVSVQPAEPTMQETAEWLTKNLPAKAHYSGSDGQGETSFGVTDASVADCVCKFTTTHQISVKGGLLRPLVTQQRVTIPAASLDGRNIRLETNTVNTPAQIALFLPTERNAKVIQAEDVRSRRVGMYPLTVLYFGEKDTAERFVKAFTRLAVLCHATPKETF